MITRRTKILLGLFLLIAVVGVGYAGSEYAGLFPLFGEGYVVRVELQDSGGLFTNSEVTYRGVSVGRVSALTLTDTGTEADLLIDPTAPKIPANAQAVVADRSAVGEQYVDLVPSSGGSPYLHGGSVIPVNRTQLPPTPQSLLTNLDSLVKSVPIGSLQTTVDELGKAFNGSGPALQQLLDSSNSFVTTAQQNLPQTTQLWSNANTVLQTQQSQASQIDSFSSGLLTISQQLKQSDPDLRRLINVAPQASQQVNDLLHSSGNDLGVLMANLVTTMKITQVRLPGIEETLVAMPVISAFTHSLSPDATGHEAIILDVDDPPSCTSGYQGTVHYPGSDTADHPSNPNAGCNLPASSGAEVRGSENVPREPVPAPAPAPPPLPLR